MELPRLVVNAKAYPEALGGAVVALARACDAEGRRVGLHVALAVPATEVRAVAALALPNVHAWGQHVDAPAPGAATGAVLAEQLQSAGASATLLNHAERKVGAALQPTVMRLREIRFPVLACADSVAEAITLAKLRPEAIAIEPPELIGGAVSVTTADPGIVRNAVAAVHQVDAAIPVLCGAGVKTGEDARAARKLGAHGVLLASGVVTAKSQTAALRDILAGLA